MVLEKHRLASIIFVANSFRNSLDISLFFNPDDHFWEAYLHACEKDQHQLPAGCPARPLQLLFSGHKNSLVRQ
jgi:hypothetical protein